MATVLRDSFGFRAAFGLSLALTLAGCCQPCKVKNLSTMRVKSPSEIRAATSAARPADPCPTQPAPQGGQTITTLEPDYTTAGSPEFRLVVTGTGFVGTSQVCWNGTTRPTKYVDATKVTAHIFEEDVAQIGDVPVRVGQDNTASEAKLFKVIGAGTLGPSVEVVGAEASSTKAASAAAAFDVGWLIGGLSGALDKLKTMMKDMTNDMISVVSQLQASAHAVIDDLSDQLGDKLTHTEDMLKDMERQLFQDGQKLLNQLNVAAEQLESSAVDRAVLTMREADIFAYNTTQNLPCHVKEGRLVYARSLNDKKPLQLRLGLDANEIDVMGNWLDMGDRPTVTLAGKRCQYADTGGNPATDCIVKGVAADRVVLTFPDGHITNPTNPQGESVEVKATTSLCKPRAFFGGKVTDNGEKSTFITVIPRKEYTVYVRIWGTAKVRSVSTWNWQQPFYYREENCDGYARHDRVYRLPNSVDYELVTNPFAKLTVTSGPNCNSGVDAVRRNSASTVLVEAHVGGCGKSWVFNCNGRGWLGYVLDMNYYYWRLTALEQVEHRDANVVTPYNKLFPYTGAIPTNNKYLSWHYYVRVLVKQGSAVNTVELTEDDELAEGYNITTSQNSSTGAVTVNIPSGTMLAKSH